MRKPRRPPRKLTGATEITMPGLYRIRPFDVEALQWHPGDLAAAGSMAGWLMRLKADFSHPGGLGETTTLSISQGGTTVTALPGDWVVLIEGERFLCTRPEVFAVIFEPREAP